MCNTGYRQSLNFKVARGTYTNAGAVFSLVGPTPLFRSASFKREERGVNGRKWARTGVPGRMKVESG
jgi:hypothetical protein